MVDNPSARKPGTVSRRWPWVSGVVAVVLSVSMGAIIAIRSNGPVLLDDVWLGVIVEHREWWIEAPALVLNFIGGGWFAVFAVPVGILLWLILVRKRWAATYFALSALASVAAVQLLKAILGRPRPEEMLVAVDSGSFPSGHVANAATIVVVLALIFARTWIWFVGVAYVVVMAFSRTYLGVHWLSDTVGGALLGAGIAVIVWAPLAERLYRERNRQSTTDSGDFA